MRVARKGPTITGLYMDGSVDPADTNQRNVDWSGLRSFIRNVG